MKTLENPIVKSILTVLALGLTGTPGVPALAPFAPFLSPFGTFLLGALHVQRPGDVKAGES
jgi:hypothetical protein